jgi:DNA-binding transcriptional MerR regulator
VHEGKFKIGEVCSLLGVKQHVLRYWEREVPLLSPRKGVSGHRIYSWADIELLFRIRHLLTEKGYTLAGVKQRLWSETGPDLQDAKAGISALRVELVLLARRAAESRRKLGT